MVRVLMLLEDYGELMFLQTILKKIGFDVEAQQNAHAFQEGLLRINPDVVIMTAFGKKVRGVDLSPTVRKTRDVPHVVLLHATSQAAVPVAGVDRWLPTPIGALKLVDAIAELCELDQALLRDKFNRIQLHEVEAETKRRIESPAEADPEAFQNTSSVSTEERQARFKSFLKDQPALPARSFQLKDIQAEVKRLRAQESPAEAADLERERKEFVAHLFRKKA